MIPEEIELQSRPARLAGLGGVADCCPDIDFLLATEILADTIRLTPSRPKCQEYIPHLSLNKTNLRYHSAYVVMRQ